VVSAGLCPTNRVKENTTAKAAINAETVRVFTYALLLPAFVDASHIRVVAYRDATERAFGPEIGISIARWVTLMSLSITKWAASDNL
jgi:hypothetical protein